MIHTCIVCAKVDADKDGTPRDRPRLPKGWKDIGGPTCPACVKGGWHVRALSLPVASVLEPAAESFFAPFTAAWRQSTDLANWAAGELLRHDVRRTPDMERLPPFAALNLYRRWNELAPPDVRGAWDGATQAAATILKAVEDTWRNHPRFGRHAVLWRGEASAATYRWPYPWVVPAQAVRVGWDDEPGGRLPWVSVILPGGRHKLRLDHGSGFRRVLKDFDRLVSGEARLGDVKVVGRKKGGRLVGVDVRITGRFPRAAKRNGDRAAIIRTDPAALLVVEVPGLPDWHLRMDCVERTLHTIRRYEEQRQRFADDLKREVRWPASKRRRYVKVGGVRADRQHRRLKSLVQMSAAQAVAYALRKGCCRVAYNDDERSYVETFPWHALRERVRCKCEEGGAEFEVVSSAEVKS